MLHLLVADHPMVWRPGRSFALQIAQKPSTFLPPIRGLHMRPIPVKIFAVTPRVHDSLEFRPWSCHRFACAAHCGFSCQSDVRKTSQNLLFSVLGFVQKCGSAGNRGLFPIRRVRAKLVHAYSYRTLVRLPSGVHQYE